MACFWLELDAVAYLWFVSFIAAGNGAGSRDSLDSALSHTIAWPPKEAESELGITDSH